jgi:hypothetical protein
MSHQPCEDPRAMITKILRILFTKSPIPFRHRNLPRRPEWQVEFLFVSAKPPTRLGAGKP